MGSFHLPNSNMASCKLTMIFAVVIAVFVLANAAPRGDDGSVDVAGIRVRRDDYHGGEHYGGGYKKGRVGPVYTSVKTDHKANFKWSVKHNVGSHYASGGH